MKGKGGEGEEAGSEQKVLRAEGLTPEPIPWGQILTLPLATEDTKPLTPPNPGWLIRKTGRVTVSPCLAELTEQTVSAKC